MKRRIKMALITMILSILFIVPTTATELQWTEVTFKMMVPDGYDIPSPIYVMYTGNETDLFAELSEDNNFESTVQALPGAYTVYQIVPTSETEETFMAKSDFSVTNSPQTIYVYIRNEDGILNEDITDEETPNNLASYGEMIAQGIEAQQNKQQMELSKQQEAAAVGNSGSANQSDLATNVDDGSRQSKINTVSATEDSSVEGLTGLMIIVCAILGIVIITVIVVLLRQYSKIKGAQNANDDSKSNGTTLKN